MAHRQSNVSRGKLFITLLIVAIVVQVVPHRHTKRLNILFRSVFNRVLSVSVPGFSKVFRAPPSTAEFVARSEYEELLKVYKNTHGQLLEMQRRYEALSGVRSGLPKPGPGLVLARVITSAINSFGQEIIINEGADAGLKIGQLVLDQGKTGVVGSVSELHETTATVRLLTDSKHTIMVAVWREGKEDYVERQMVGDGKDACKIPLVSREYDLRVGDTVFASPKRGVLDTPIIIGEVAAIRPDEDRPLLWDITVRPIFDRQALTDVAIVVMASTEAENR